MDRDEVEKSLYSPRSQYVSHNFARPFYFFFLHYTTLYYSSQWASFSTCNENLIIAAPGVTIWGLDTKVRAGSDFGPYRVAGGTSMAAAHVSGIIAKIWSVCPLCSDVQVTSCIKTSAKYLGNYAWCFGAGLVQAEDAYTCLAEEENCC
jgi:subtilisin family serine protease